MIHWNTAHHLPGPCLHWGHSGSHSWVYTEMMQGIDCISPDPTPKSLICRSGWTLASEFSISVSGNSDTGGQQASISDTVTITPLHSTLEEGEVQRRGGAALLTQGVLWAGTPAQVVNIWTRGLPWSFTRCSVSPGLLSPMATSGKCGIWDVTQSELGGSGGSPIWPLSCLLYMYIDTWYMGLCMCSCWLSLHLLWKTCCIKGIFKERKQDCWGEW